MGRLKKESLAYVKDRVQRKIQGWKQQFISQAKHEELIKVVSQAVPAYLMDIFKFPDTLSNEIDVAFARFWWGQREDKRKIHWISWETMGYSKSEWGMRFRNLKEFNIALLAKKCWRLIHDLNSMWAWVLKEQYVLHISFLEAKKGGRASWIWSNLLEERELLLKGAHWQVMSGKKKIGLINGFQVLIVVIQFLSLEWIWTEKCLWSLLLTRWMKVGS